MPMMELKYVHEQLDELKIEVNDMREEITKISKLIHHDFKVSLIEREQNLIRENLALLISLSERLSDADLERLKVRQKIEDLSNALRVPRFRTEDKKDNE